MSEFSVTFSGLRGERPEEYLQDVELFLMRQTTKFDVDLFRLSAFRQGLRGGAKEWYLDLPLESRQWDTLKTMFCAQFCRSNWTNRRQVAERVRNFVREPGEPLSSFLHRAKDVAKRCDQSQRQVMRDRLFYDTTWNSESDRLIWGLLVVRLKAAGKLDDRDGLLDACTYYDVKTELELTAVSVGETIKEPLATDKGAVVVLPAMGCRPA